MRSKVPPSRRKRQKEGKKQSESMGITGYMGHAVQVACDRIAKGGIVQELKRLIARDLYGETGVKIVQSKGTNQGYINIKTEFTDVCHSDALQVANDPVSKELEPSLARNLHREIENQNSHTRTEF
jgi:hypothetical protein